MTLESAPATLRRSTVLPSGPAALASLMEPLLLEASGPGAEPVSLSLDYGVALAPGAEVIVEAGVERATRTLVFAFSRVVSAGGEVLATGSAIFRRPPPPANPV